MTTTRIGFDDFFRLDPQALRCPFPAYRQSREERPVFRSEASRAYVVTRYSDIAVVLRNTATYSSAVASGPRSLTPVAAQLAAAADTPPTLRRQAERRVRISESTVLLNADPPAHARQRKLVNRGSRPAGSPRWRTRSVTSRTR
jgi:cytochrome P450